MKSLKKLILLSIAIVSLLPFTSCKKGENDPALSFRSRTNRISGTWELKKADYKEFTRNGTDTLENSTNIVDGTAKTTNNVLTGNTVNSTYEMTLLVRKDGSYTLTTKEVIRELAWDPTDFTEKELDVTYSVTTNGYWNFLPANKTVDVKNKERVMFTPRDIVTTKSTEGIASQRFSQNSKISISGSTVYLLDMLKHKEMAAIIDEITEYTDRDEDGVDTKNLKTLSGTYEFSKS